MYFALPLLKESSDIGKNIYFHQAQTAAARSYTHTHPNSRTCGVNTYLLHVEPLVGVAYGGLVLAHLLVRVVEHLLQLIERLLLADAPVAHLVHLARALRLHLAQRRLKTHTHKHRSQA